MPPWVLLPTSIGSCFTACGPAVEILSEVDNFHSYCEHPMRWLDYLIERLAVYFYLLKFGFKTKHQRVVCQQVIASALSAAINHEIS